MSAVERKRIKTSHIDNPLSRGTFAIHTDGTRNLTFARTIKDNSVSLSEDPIRSAAIVEDARSAIGLINQSRLTGEYGMPIIAMAIGDIYEGLQALDTPQAQLLALDGGLNDPNRIIRDTIIQRFTLTDRSGKRLYIYPEVFDKLLELTGDSDTDLEHKKLALRIIDANPTAGYDRTGRILDSTIALFSLLPFDIEDKTEIEELNRKFSNFFGKKGETYQNVHPEVFTRLVEPTGDQSVELLHRKLALRIIAENPPAAIDKSGKVLDSVITLFCSLIDDASLPEEERLQYATTVLGLGAFPDALDEGIRSKISAVFERGLRDAVRELTPQTSEEAEELLRKIAQANLDRSGLKEKIASAKKSGKNPADVIETEIQELRKHVFFPESLTPTKQIGALKKLYGTAMPEAIADLLRQYQWLTAKIGPAALPVISVLIKEEEQEKAAALQRKLEETKIREAREKQEGEARLKAMFPHAAVRLILTGERRISPRKPIGTTDKTVQEPEEETSIQQI